MDLKRIEDMVRGPMTKHWSDRDRENALIDIVHLLGESFLDMLENPQSTANVHELMEWCYPDTDDLPGSDEDEEQTEYIRRLEAFEDMLCIAAKPAVAVMYAKEDKGDSPKVIAQEAEMEGREDSRTGYQRRDGN